MDTQQPNSSASPPPVPPTGTPVPGQGGYPPPCYGLPPWIWQKPRRRFRWFFMLVVLFNIAVFGVICAGFFKVFGDVGHQKPFQTEVVRESKSEEVVAVVPLYGMVDASMAQFARKTLHELVKEPKVVAVILRIDTPGGTVEASDQIYHAVCEYRKATSRPVVVSQGAYATSGGYYISVAGDYIISERSTNTANIGVFIPVFNLAGGMKKWGIEYDDFKSDRTPYKDVPNPFAELTEAQRAYVRDMVDTAYEQFLQVVEEGRPNITKFDKAKLDELARTHVVIPSSQPDQNVQREKRPVLAFADGRVFSAKHALEAGLIDQIGYEADAYDKAAELAHAREPKIVLYKPRTSVLAELFGGGSESSAEAARMRASMRQLDSMLSSQPMYLYPTQNFVQNWPIINYAQP